MAIISSIISAIGNNSSIYPLIVRDCGIEVPTKVYKTYKQNKDDNEIAYLATRERLIDEYATSAVWLGGIPLISKIAGMLIKRSGYNPKVNIKLVNAEEKLEKIDKQISTTTDDAVKTKLLKERANVYLQSISGNIEKFSGKEGTEDIIESLKKVKQNKNIYKRLQANKLFAEIAIPMAFMGYIIPKSVYALTAATRRKIDKLKTQNIKTQETSFTSNYNMDKFIKNSKKDISFNGNLSSSLCNMTTVQKMAATDGGYAVGRVATARKKKGAVDIAFRMAGMMYLNFVAPKQIEKILSWTSKQLFNLNVDLDPKILNDNEFIRQISNKTIELPKTNELKDILEFIDNPANKDTLYVKYLKELKIVDFLDNDVRNPAAYVEEESVIKLKNNIEAFMNGTENLKNRTMEKLKDIKIQDKEKEINKAIKGYIRKAKGAKTFNIISNVALSSYLLACVLPDAQYLFREKVLGTKLEPDLL